MRAFDERGPAIAFCILAMALTTGTSSAEGVPGDGEDTQGIKRLELSRYYEAQAIPVSPQAPTYSLPIQFSDISNSSIFWLDDNAKEAIERNGFVVVEAMYEDMVAPYGRLKEDGKPNFVTSDSLLHLYHVQFDEILRCVEEKEFFPRLAVMSNALFEESRSQYDSFSGDLKEAARRNVGYFGVVLKLLGAEVNVPDFVSAEVNSEVEKIEAHSGFSPSDIFTYNEDYSQYVPRGHYTRSETLKKFFKAMMWYGRMSFLLKGSNSYGPTGEALVSIEDAKIQTMQASLITLALDSLEAEGKPIADIWNRVYAVTAFFVGLADDLTPYEYKESILKVFGSPVEVEELDNEDRMLALKTELALLRSPQIYGGTGECYVDPPLSPEQLNQVLAKTKGMRFMGQRFIPDSYMFEKLVAPTVGFYMGSGSPFTCVEGIRGFPRGLDVMVVLGSDEALAILEREGDTDYVGYDTALNELVALFDSFTEDDWNKNLYWSWLYTLKSLLGSYGQGYPAFMQGTAWQDKELHAALASWAELRHDTILYAKQSYTVNVTTSVPPQPPEPDRGYVEPVPEFYGRLLALTRMTRTGLDDMNVLDDVQRNRLQGLESALSRLTEISIAELEGRELSEDDYDYIEHFGSIIRPLVEGLSDDKGAKTMLIADVHTDGNSRGVLEEGVGYVKLIVVAYLLPEGRIVLGAGPVFSYYEFKWPMNDRLTDEKWTEMLKKGDAPAQPEWVRSFVHPVSLPLENSDDVDRDQLSDTWERAIWSDIAAVNDPNGDYDGDGVTNRQEYLAETNPADADSSLRVLDILAEESGAVLRWSSVAGKRYRVSHSDDLRTWHPVGTPVSAAGATADFCDHCAPSPNRRFYRVSVVQ